MTVFAKLAALALAALALLTAGCGKTLIDLSKTEDQLQAEAERSSPGKKVAAVSCPDDVEVEPKAEFTCTVRYSGGETETATLLIRDQEANLTLVSLQPDK